MLRQLTLRDFVIVAHLELSFSAGFSALTGETGAGKSILIDALGLALGERADAGVVRQGADKAEVVAVFAIERLPVVQAWLQEQDFAVDEELMLRRIVDASGRSRAYINGSPATVQQLREVGEWLVDIHGQHAHQSLLRRDAQRDLLDAYAGLQAEVKSVAEAYRAWQAAEQALAHAQTQAAALRQTQDQLLWQIEALAELGLADGEWEALEAEHRRLANAAGLLNGVQSALTVLAEDEGACSGQIDGVASRLAGLCDFDPALQGVVDLLASVQTELSEATSDLRRYRDRLELDPLRLSEVEQRIQAVMALARKFRVAPEALPALLQASERQLADLSAAVDIDNLSAAVAKQLAIYEGHARRLSSGRQQAAQSMANAVTEVMHQLALGGGRFELALLPLAPCTVNGCEQVEFRLAGLAGDASRPLAKVASGGELSRLSLAIQVVASRVLQVPTQVFDEVDVGIGGGVAEIVGRLLNTLGGERQVLCVTHLPQVAARADWQWQVSKSTVDGQTLSMIGMLDQAGREKEIARMLGGVDITDITLQHAREMLRSTS